jgi:hypothetical protein
VVPTPPPPAPAGAPPPLPIAAPIVSLAPPHTLSVPVRLADRTPADRTPPVRATVTPHAAATPHAALAPARVGAELPVEHQHVFGSCRGTLRVSPSGVAFVASDSRDTFTFEPGRFESALGDRTLTLKDGKRTYRFKAANGAGQGGAADLRAFASAISDIRPR